MIENGFKIRTRLGTNGSGRYIKLKDPELAIVIECPRAWEKNINMVAKKMKVRERERDNITEQKGPRFRCP
jgi:hypothetical protein